MHTKPSFLIAALLLMAFFTASCSRNNTDLHETIMLKNWHVKQSTSLLDLPGNIVSGPSLDTSLWYRADVPSTIMGVLTANGLYPNLFMADSIKQIDAQPFNKSWWYRTSFVLPEMGEEQHVALHFDGINYYANIWLNGSLVASRDSVYGTFRRFAFDITSLVNDSVNILAVEVFKPQPGDLAHGFVDWNPAPPDGNMGLWREAYLKINGDVSINHVFVQSDVNTETLDEASLTITTDLVNHSSRAISGKLTGTSEDFSFSVPVHLKAGETRQLKLTSADIAALQIRHPRLWWCNNMGEPNLYNLKMEYVTNKAISDAQQVTFGIREIEAYTNAGGHKGFKLNGKEVLIRGAGWTDDIFFRDTPETNEIQVQYVKHMNLNTIRFENIWGTSRNIYELCDKYGILAMVGWSCQWEWPNYLGKECDEYGGIKSQHDMDLIVESLGHQIRYLQNSAAVFVWLLGSDMLPRPALEKRYAELISSIDNRPYLGAASWRKSEVSGPTGVKMKGPYNYVGPSYWYIDSVNGGAYGFNTETGPGPQIPVRETIEKMIPGDRLWPVNDLWNYHCNPSEAFGDLHLFNDAMNKRYGQPSSLDNYLLKANVQGYEAMKGMFEAFRANRPNTTGIIQWMLNSAWPSFYWQLYDYYLLPTSAYYAARKANAPVQLVYHYGNNGIFTVNETLQAYPRAIARIRLVDLKGKDIFSEEVVVDLAENKPQKVYQLSSVAGNAFLALTLFDEHNTELASNFYWLSGKPDVYVWEKTEWYFTPLKSGADFRGLNYLGPAKLNVSQVLSESDKGKVITLKLTNAPEGVAFFVNLTLKDNKQHTVYPVCWNDNYVSLLPGETKELQCTLPEGSAEGKDFTVTVSGWNVNEQTIKLAL